MESCLPVAPGNATDAPEADDRRQSPTPGHAQNSHPKRAGFAGRQVSPSDWAGSDCGGGRLRGTEGRLNAVNSNWVRRWLCARGHTEGCLLGVVTFSRRCLGFTTALIVSLLWMAGPGPATASALVDDAVVGNAGEQEPVNFALTLPLRNPSALQDLLTHLYTPGDPQFHHFLSSSEFDQQFAPTAAQYESLKSLASEYGLTIVGEHSGRTLLDVSAPAQTIRHVFGSQMQVRQQGDGRRYFSPNRDAELPFPLAAMGADVTALRQKPWHTHYVQGAQVSQSEAVAKAGRGSQGSYEPTDIKAAYNLNSIQNGGQTVALFELSSATYSDASHYASQFGLRNPTLVQKLVDGGTSDTTNAIEVVLDIEMVMAVANPSSVIVYTGPDTGSGMLDTYVQIADDNLVNQVSTSWGICEADIGQSGVTAESAVFSKMVAEGMAVFSASGDSGAYDCGTVAGGIGVDDPSSQPYVTGVGGTHLTTTSAQGYSAESVWDTNTSEAGGGGISAFWSIPSYQVGVVSSAPVGQFSSSMRNVPDVSLNADPSTGYLVYATSSGQAGWWVIGGTSAAAPQWAAFWSLIGAGLAQKGVSPAQAGYANPTIYGIAKGATAYARDFHDVTTGNNNYFSAAAGYDDASGWGSYNAANLYADVIAAVSNPAPKITISASPTSITAGQALVLTWSSTNATSCSTSSGNGWSSGIALPASGSLSGSVQTAGTYTYGLTCTGSGGSSSAAATLTVAASAKPAVSISFSPSTIAVGQTAMLTWSSTNAAGCSTSSGTGWSSGIALPASGSLSGAIQTAGTFTYGITCTGSGGSSSGQTTLSVTATPTVNIAFTPSTIAVGQTATLSWSSVNATACVTSGSGWPDGVQLPVSGSVGTGAAPVVGTVSVGLTCTGASGSVSGVANLQITAN